ncbi:ribonuclease H-like domain-containing protein [Immersiella caudata]|uniref:Ribonuclease H-like domain-containing protein n=1 Tax=Immersiella caudata TaxID=314043 RepID=A0AA39WYI6_9PEZI|nr:ribonuclease H-like domain-containing protein [Immersiella caudata]
MSTSAAGPETVISTVAALEAFLSTITPTSALYLDLEGTNLCRHGNISLITILIHPQKTTRLIDVQTLGNLVFTTASPNDPHKSLKSILEDESIRKFLWDTRNDADALWAHYKVALNGVTDVQLMENASREGSKEFLGGLDKCVQYGLSLGYLELSQWLRTKQDVKSMMSNGVFAKRPMEEKTVQYCVGDVQYLPKLYEVYGKKLNKEWMEKARSAGYEPQGPRKKFGPWGVGVEYKGFGWVWKQRD